MTQPPLRYGNPLVVDIATRRGKSMQGKRNFGIGRVGEYKETDYRFLRQQSPTMREAELISAPAISSPLRAYILIAAGIGLVGYLYCGSLFAWFVGL